MNISEYGWRLRVGLCLMLCACACGTLHADPAVDDYNFAAWLYNNGKYDVAVGSYETFLKNYSDHEKVPEARFGLAQALFHLQRFDDARKAYQVLRDSHPDFAQMAEVLFQMGQSGVALKEFKEAEGLFAEVRSLFPDHYLSDWALARQGACLLSLEQNAQSVDLLRDFVARYAPDNRPPERSTAVRQLFKRMQAAGASAEDAFLRLIERSLFYLGMAQFNVEAFDDARQSFERFLSLYSKSALAEEVQFRLAQCLYRTDRFLPAAEAFIPVAAGEGPFAATAVYERGLSLYKTKRFKEASDVLAEMASRFPADANAGRAALHAGTFLYEAADYAGAAERLRPAAAKGAPFADEASYWLGMSLLKGGAAAEAEQVFSEALKVHGKSAFAGDMRLGLADSRLAQDNMTGAAEIFADYARRSGKSESAPQALYSACVALHRAEQYEASDARCADFIKQFTDHELVGQVLFLSGENRFLRRQYELAAERYAAFLEQASEAPERRARAYFRMAWCFRHQNRFEEALSALEKMDLKSAEKAIVSEVLYVRGASLFDLERYADSEQALAAYLKEDPKGRFADDAILKQAMGQARLGGTARAAASFERFLSLYPDSELAGQTHYQLAESLFELARYEPASAQYAAVLEDERAADLHPFALLGQGRCAFSLEDWRTAAERFGELASRYPTSPLHPQALYRQGQALMRDEAWGAAEVPLLALTSAYPEHELAPPAWVALGTCRQKREDWQAAADAFARSAAGLAEEEQPRILYELAWSHREAGDLAAALKGFERLAGQFPDDPLSADANFHLGEAVYRTVDATQLPLDEKAREALREASALYRRVIDLARDARLTDKAWYRLGWCRWLLGEYAGASDAFDTLVELYKDSDLVPDSLYQSGLSMAHAGSMGDAIKRYETLTGTRRYADGFEYLPEAYVALAEAQTALSRERDALQSLQRAIETGGEGPSATRAYFLNGKLLYQLGRHDEALESLAAVTRRTRSALAAEAQFYIGQTEQTRQRYDQALVAYLRIQAIYAAFPEWVAGSLLETGKCHEALGRPEEARKAYERVVKEFKGTRWAPLAQERLAKGGGH